MDDYIIRGERGERKVTIQEQMGQSLIKGAMKQGKVSGAAPEQQPRPGMLGGMIATDKISEIAAMRTDSADPASDRQGRLTTTYGMGPSPRQRIGVHILNKMQNTIPESEGLEDLKTFNNVKKFNASRTIKNMMGSIFTRKPRAN